MKDLLGVVIFMPIDAVMKILSLVASLPPGSGVAFDYGIPDSSLTWNQRMLRESGAGQAAALGEPYVTFLDPFNLATDLKQMGFTHIDDCGPDAINRQYFVNRNDGLCVASSGRRLIGAIR